MLILKLMDEDDQQNFEVLHLVSLCDCESVITNNLVTNNFVKIFYK